jgi:Zn-dependent peptidase ImmA (M78 family)/transcriptional regulator with XRE-family HTH domain
MEPLFTPAMLVMTREAKGWSQRDLAQRTGLSQAVISKIESGAVEVSEERLTLLADKLDCPPKLLCQPAPLVDNANTCLHHRRRASKLSAAATRRIEGIAHLTRLTVEGIFEGVQVQLETDVEPAEFAAASSSAMSVEVRSEDASPTLESGPFDLSRADSAARRLREQWHLTGPIANLIETLEQHGILVVHRSLGSRAQDGVSSWPADLAQPPLIVINQDLPADRARFTVAHELGHLLLHRTPSDNAENEANRFAGELLVPAADIVEELSGLTTGDFARLARLKEKWGVSIGMLVQRARDLEVISDRQFREFRVRLSRLGWDINEPGSLRPETPTLLNKAINIGRETYGLSTEELANMACMTTAGFERHYLQSQLQPRTVRQVLNSPSTPSPGAIAGVPADGTYERSGRS